MSERFRDERVPIPPPPKPHWMLVTDNGRTCRPNAAGTTRRILNMAITSEQVALHWEHIGLCNAVNRAEFKTHGGALAQNMLLQLDAWVLTERLDELARDISYPATWWDAVKHRWFPAWARNRWPARFIHEHIRFRGVLAYPDSPVKRNGQNWAGVRVVRQNLDMSWKEILSYGDQC